MKEPGSRARLQTRRLSTNKPGSTRPATSAPAIDQDQLLATASSLPRRRAHQHLIRRHRAERDAALARIFCARAVGAIKAGELAVRLDAGDDAVDRLVDGLLLGPGSARGSKRSRDRRDRRTRRRCRRRDDFVERVERLARLDHRDRQRERVGRCADSRAPARPLSASAARGPHERRPSGGNFMIFGEARARPRRC